MNRDLVFLTHIVKSCDKIAVYTVDVKQSFFENALIQDAVIRNLEIIGEASKNLSVATKSQASEQPWR